LLVPSSPTSSTVEVNPLSDRMELERNVLVAGCAPLLGVLAGCLGRSHADARATWVGTNSMRAIELLRHKLVHVAGLHLVTTETPGGHSAIVRRHFDNETMTIVNLARWRQGLIVRKNNPLRIRGVGDLVRKDLRVAHRDPGAGARKLLERLLREQGVDTRQLASGPLASGHGEVARWVRLGFADAGVGAEAAALGEALSFVPLAEERFDLVVPTTRLDARPVARLLELIESPSFRADARELAGYDLSSAGHASTVPAR
jgi:molybdate-binding protein